MIDALNKLNEFFYLDYEINIITSANNSKSREDVLRKFEKNNKIQLLFSIRILDECIDIPSCDSIFITYPCKNKIRLIQRLCRCIRIDKNNEFKIGNIFIWCNEYDEITDTLSGIKEYDIEFKDKIFVNEIDFYGESSKVEFKNDIKLLENYIVGIKEFRCYSWEEKLKQVEDYIIANDKLPSSTSKDIEICKRCKFIYRQSENYKNNLQIMKNKDIRNKWENFINKYNELFLSNEDNWYKTIKKIEKYINDYNKTPSKKDKDENVKILGIFLCHQNQNYKKGIKNMKNEIIKKDWEIFKEKYKKYLLSNDEIWYDNLKQMEEYIIKNNRLPKTTDKNVENKKILRFYNTTKNNYKKNDRIMKNIDIKNRWDKFINDYKEYL